MNETTLKMAMAGFFHDIGKFADKKALGVSEKYFNDNAGIYLPFWDGHYSHHHALYTASFIEQMKEFLPSQLNSGHWGEGDAFINLAAGHHNAETPMQQIVSVADRLTSGIDRDEFESAESQAISFRDYKRTRLLPLFEQLDQPPKQDGEDFSYVYPLKRLSPHGIFPLKRTEIDKKEAEEEYLKLYDQFVNDLRGLRHRDENLSLWFEHFEDLMMIYTSCIPAARVGRVIHDVSLYDHSRLTAAFAAALYAYHVAADALNAKAISNEEDEKFLLVSGNFYGIQNFIFSSHGDTRKHRAKMLRGRSFYVSLLTELAADRVCGELELPHICTIFNAAGRFTVLCPNTRNAKSKIEEAGDAINAWLYEVSYGEVAMGLSTVTATQRAFLPDRFQKLWDDMGTAGEKNKYQKLDLKRHGGIVRGYLDSFRNDLERPLCPLCGKRPAAVETDQGHFSERIGSVCRICRDQVFIGTKIVKDTEVSVLETINGEKKACGDLLEPIFGRYQLQFGRLAPEDALNGRGLRKAWDISILGESSETEGISRKFLNRYVPRYQEEDKRDLGVLTSGMSPSKLEELFKELRMGDPLPFHVISLKSKTVREDKKVLGLDALGILKADVDNLGMLMACGLPKERFTISRLATLSRQLNYYFALYLPNLLMTDQRFRNVYTVFAGGDDLFVIGPWNRIYELSLHIQDRFAAYTCGNEAMHISAGLILKKPHAPLNTLAGAAEEALETSKSTGKKRLTMFNETVSWEDVETLEKVRTDLEEWYQNKWISKSMLYRLNNFIDLAEAERRLREKEQISIAEMSCLKWRALFSYSAGRNIAKDVRDVKEREKIIGELSTTMTQWLENLGGALRIPLWNMLYNYR